MILQLEEKVIVPSNPVLYGFERRMQQGILISSSAKMRTNRLYTPKGDDLGESYTRNDGINNHNVSATVGYLRLLLFEPFIMKGRPDIRKHRGKNRYYR